MSLNLKIIASTICLIVIATLAILFFVDDEIEASFEAEHNRWTQTLVESVAEATVNQMMRKQVSNVTDTFRRLIESNSNIAYLFMTDIEGKLFAHTFDGPIPKLLLNQIDNPIENTKWSIQNTLFQGEEITESRFQLFKDLGARIVIGVRRDGLTSAVRNTNRNILLVSLVTLIIGIIGAILLAGSISKPISSLASSIVSFRKGELTELPTFQYLDNETKQLMVNFSEMVSEKTRLENRMRQDYERLSAAQNIGKIGDWSMDILTGKVVWSDETFRIYELEPQSFEPSLDYFLGLIDPEDKPEFTKAREALIHSQIPYKFETKLNLSDTHQKYIHLAGEPKLNSDGELIGLFGTIQDITQRKLTELELQKSYEELEDRVEERTQDLKNEILERNKIEGDLKEALVETKTANRVKSEFLANMSHELRTPLNAIIGFSDAIIIEMFGPIENEKYKEYANDIQLSGMHLLSLINDILDVSAIEAGKFQLKETNVNLHEAVMASILLIKSRADLNGVKLVNSVDNRAPFLFADELRVKQILVNLLSNAVKFTPNGGTVSISASTSNDESLQIEISDTGIGMNDADITKALEKFGQIERGNLMNTREGAGLGLPLTKGLVESHGGALNISSEINCGTTVTFSVPGDRILKSDMPNIQN